MDQKRELVRAFSAEYEISTLCEVLGLARSSYYYQPQPTDDDDLSTAILAVRSAWPTYGYRRVTHQLRREGNHVNAKRVRRLMGELGLSAAPAPPKVRTTHSQHGWARYPNLVMSLEVTRPDHVWVADITYIHLRDGFVYLAILMDMFTRTIRGWALERTLDQHLTRHALEMAMARGGAPAIHHSDQGVQYAAQDYVDLLTQNGCAISMAAVGTPEENGYAERVIRTIKEEEVDLSEYGTFADAYPQLGHFLDTAYTHKRIHSSLGYLTPAEFEQQWLRQQQDHSYP